MRAYQNALTFLWKSSKDFRPILFNLPIRRWLERSEDKLNFWIFKVRQDAADLIDVIVYKLQNLKSDQTLIFRLSFLFAI